MSQLTIQPPKDYLLRRDACSYGYFLLAPNHWDPAKAMFRTTLNLRAIDPHRFTAAMATGSVKGGAPRFDASDRRPPRGVVTVLVDQPAKGVKGGRTRTAKPGSPLRVQADRSLTRLEALVAESMLARMLRLDEPDGTLRGFHKLDPRWKRSGRGRLMRSPSIFEDVIKTVTSCNVAWPSTIVMNQRLCDVLGERSASGLRAFPTSERLARARAANLRARCRVGYRDERMIEMARLFAKSRRRLFMGKELGNGDPALPAWESPELLDDAALQEVLLELPGIGPYAAANIMQLLGRYAHLPLDTESVRHGRTVLGFTGAGPKVMKRVKAHFEPFGEQRFRSYWFELWQFYESKHGPAWLWERETTGKKFTAAQLQAVSR